MVERSECDVEGEGASESETPPRRTSDGGGERARLTESPLPTAKKRPCLMALAVVFASIAALGIVVYASFGTGVTLFSFHPLCMTLGWLLLMSSAINAFSPPGYTIQLLPIQNNTIRHWSLQVSSLSFIALGFIIIVVNKILAGKYHFTSLHGVFGLISFIMVWIVASGGWGTLYSSKFKKIIAPVYLKLIHSGFGLVTYTLGLVTMILPFYSKWWTGSDFIRVPYTIMVLFVLCRSLSRPLVKWYARVRERINYIRTEN